MPFNVIECHAKGGNAMGIVICLFLKHERFFSDLEGLGTVGLMGSFRYW